MKKFDLEKALAGEPVIFKGDDQQCWVIGPSKTDNVSYIIEYDDGVVAVEKIDYLNQSFEMWQEPRPRVQLDLPAPIAEIEDGEKIYYIEKGKIVEDEFCSPETFMWDLLNSGALFKVREDAQEWLDAMKNARK